MNRTHRMRRFGFPALALVAAVVASGCKNVDRADTSGPTTTRSEHGSHLAPPQVRVSQVARSGPGPKVGDRWKVWVALNVCGQYLEPPQGTPVRGVTARPDGTVDIAPQDESEAGHNATLQAYIESVGAKLSTGSLTLPADVAPPEIVVRDETRQIAGQTFIDGAECAGVKGKVVAWIYSPEAVRTGKGLVTVAENPQDVPFFADGMAVVITFTPESSLPTLPPAAAAATNSASPDAPASSGD